MIRAGHGFALARAIVELAPGAEVDLDGLAEQGSDSSVKSVCRHFNAM